MRIFNNISALIAVNQMNKNTALQGNSMKKLSTGLRINKAGDDAAGLAISEEMRARIRGLDQGTKNVQDGISLVQTAEGAMEEIHNMIGRMNELAIQSADGTLTDSDREKVNAEVNELKEEIQNITENTNFNGIPVLQGNKTTQEKTIETVIKKVFKEYEVDGEMPSWVKMPDKLEDPKQLPSGTNISGNHAYATIDFSSFDTNNAKELVNKGFFTTCCTCNETYNIRFIDSSNSTNTPPTTIITGKVMEVNINGITKSQDLVDAIINQIGSKFNHYSKLIEDPTNPSQLIIYDERDHDKDPSAYPKPDIGRGIVGNGNSTGIKYDKITQDIEKIVDIPIDFNIQYAYESGDSMNINLPNTFLDSIGIENIDLSSQESSQDAIPLLKQGIEYISTERARMGVYDNVLEVKSNVNTTHTENLTSAESRIRDVDIAKEMIKLSKINIITQASQSMMAQAKQQPQGIMSLLN